MWWAHFGWPVFPTRGKIPAIKSPHLSGSLERGMWHSECGQLGHGIWDASTSWRQAVRHWDVHPYDGIAIRPEPDEIVLDVDPRNGGDVELAKMEAEHKNTAQEDPHVLQRPW